MVTQATVVCLDIVVIVVLEYQDILVIQDRAVIVVIQVFLDIVLTLEYLDTVDTLGLVVTLAPAHLDFQDILAEVVILDIPLLQALVVTLE